MVRIPRALLVAWLVASACAPPSESVEDYEVKVAIRRYNEQLVQAYQRGDPLVLADACTPDEMRRVGDLIDFLAQDQRVLDGRQESIELGPVTRPAPVRASVEASEVWWYRHVAFGTGEVKQAPRRVRYKNRYELLRVEGRWQVDRLRELDYAELSLSADAP